MKRELTLYHTKSSPYFWSLLWTEPFSSFFGSKIPPIFWLTEPLARSTSKYNTFTRFWNRRRNVGMREIEATSPWSLKKEKSRLPCIENVHNFASHGWELCNGKLETISNSLPPDYGLQLRSSDLVVRWEASVVPILGLFIFRSHN